jgi:hypothetical protein
MTWRVRNALRLFLSVQWRCRFPHVYLALAIPTILVFRFAIPGEFAESLVPAFLFGEPGSLALTLVAAQAYLERNERSVTALAVTPLRSGEYVLGLVLATAVVATLAGTAVQTGVFGVDRRLVLLIPPLFLTATLAGFLGLGLSACFPEFTRFLIAGLMPAMLVLSLPYASYFWFSRSRTLRTSGWCHASRSPGSRATRRSSPWRTSCVPIRTRCATPRMGPF